MHFSLEINLFMVIGLFFLTLALIIVSGIYALKYAFGKHPKRVFDIIYITILTLYLFYISFFLGIKYQLLRNDNYHIINITSLVFIIALLQFIRIILDYFDEKASRNAKFFHSKRLFKNFRDLYANCVILISIYSMIILSSESTMFQYYYKLIGYLFSGFIILRIIKFRIYDDLYKRQLRAGKSYLGPRTSHSTTILQGIYNILFRAYFFVALSFGCIYSLIVSGNLLDGNEYFCVEVNKLSGNTFLDFIYFSIITMSTVGYGDISPIGQVPKLLCIVEILFGYFFIGAIFAYIFNISSNTK